MNRPGANKEAAAIAHARLAIGQGRVADAEATARSLLAAAPANIDALEILAMAQQARGDVAAAETTLRRAIVVAPGRQWPRGDLARLLLSAGRIADAEAVLRDAVTADESHADAHAMLGALLSEHEALVPGAAHLHRAIALAGRHPQLVANLGRNLMRQGRLDEAEPLLEEAAAAMPDALGSTIHLAELAEQSDRFDQAAALLDKAEAIARRTGRDVLAQRALLLSRTEGWRDGLALLDGAPALSGTPLLLRARLRDRAGRHAEAWGDAAQAKAQLARQRGHSYSPDAVEGLFRVLKAMARGPDALPQAPAMPGAPQPIFILGFPRSGTTMTEQVLASHSCIRPGGELPFVAELASHAVHLFGPSLRPPAGKQGEDAAARLRDLYLARAREHGFLAPGADFFTDKMPLNEAYLPILRMAFPEAPLIAVSRDPRDVLASMMQHDMTHGFHCGYRLEDMAHHYAAVAGLGAHYRDAGLIPYSFRYESFVADQAGETARLMAHVGLEMEPAQLRFHESRRHAPTPSYAQVRTPLNGLSIGRWRHYERELAPVMGLLAPAIARGGY